MLESKFKAQFKKRFKERMAELDIPIAIIENKPNPRSFPDTTFLGPGVWAVLDFKKSKDASHQPNQDYYIRELGSIGFACFVYPENAEEVFNELEELFAFA